MGNPVIFILDQDPGWQRAYTLGKVIYEMCEKGQQDTWEFQALLQYYGRERCRQLYAQYRDSLKDNELKGGHFGSTGPVPHRE